MLFLYALAQQCGGGGSAGLGNMDMTGLNAALDEILSEYQKAWNDAFDAMNQNANKFADNVSKAFKQGGLQSVGEYIGKIYMETKNRPRFIVEEQLK